MSVLTSCLPDYYKLHMYSPVHVDVNLSPEHREHDETGSEQFTTGLARSGMQATEDVWQGSSNSGGPGWSRHDGPPPGAGNGGCSEGGRPTGQLAASGGSPGGGRPGGPGHWALQSC